MTIPKNTVFLLILLSFMSCIDKEPQDPKPIRETKITRENSKKEIVRLNEKKNKGTLDISFIGKRSADIDSYVLHECFGSILGGNATDAKYFISEYSEIIDECRNGKNKIVFGRYDKRLTSQTPDFKILDELNVVVNDPKLVYYHVPLVLGNNEEMNYLVEFEDNREEVIKKVFRIWKIDFEKEKFVEIVKPENFTFLNPDYIEE